MQLTQTKPFRILVGPGLFVIGLSLLDFSFRRTGLVLFFALLVSCVYFLRASNTKPMRLLFVAFLIVVFLPVDVTLLDYPGPPRFVPLIMGLPRDNAIAMEARGEAVLGGCILRGNEPRWVLVW